MVFTAGETLILKKPHPCGSLKFEVVRTGADYKLKCLGCGHVVLLTAAQLKARIRGRAERNERE